MWRSDKLNEEEDQHCPHTKLEEELIWGTQEEREGEIMSVVCEG